MLDRQTGNVGGGTLLLPIVIHVDLLVYAGLCPDAEMQVQHVSNAGRED